MEVLGSRLLSPYFGVGLFVWSSLITVTLTALSIGYWLGGRWADKNPNIRNLYNLILVSGVLTFIIPYISSPILMWAGHLGLRLGSLVSAAILFGAPLFMLAMVSPYAVKLYTPDLSVLGRHVGHLYAISTIGSVVGALITGFVLVPYFGVSRVLVILSASMIFVWGLHFLFVPSAAKVQSLVVVIFSGVLSMAPLSPAQAHKGTLVYETDSLYGHLRVLDKGEKRHLLIDGAPNSGINTVTGFSIYPYTYALELPHFIHPEGKTALVVGLGGGSVVNRLREKGYQVDAVEIDPDVLKIATTYFNFKPLDSQISLQDARHHLLTTQKAYDLIILDVFSGDLAPLHLFSQEALTVTKTKLAEKGILAINFIGVLDGGPSRVPKSIFKTLSTVFNDVDVYPLSPHKKMGNIIFLSSQNPLQIRKSIASEPIPVLQELFQKMLNQKLEWHEDSGFKEAILLTDDYNPVQSWNAKAAELWRNNFKGRF